MSGRHYLVTFALLVPLALASCGNSSSQEDYSVEGSRGLFSNGEFDEDKARDAVVEDLSGESFEDVGDTSDCTEDCSGHEAGFEWAKEHSITDESECGTDSQSFEEGCEAYVSAVDEQVEEKRDEFESGEGGEE